MGFGFHAYMLAEHLYSTRVVRLHLYPNFLQLLVYSLPCALLILAPTTKAVIHAAMIFLPEIGPPSVLCAKRIVFSIMLMLKFNR